MTPKPSERPLWFLPLLGFLIPVGIGGVFLFFQWLQWESSSQRQREAEERAELVARQAQKSRLAQEAREQLTERSPVGTPPGPPVSTPSQENLSSMQATESDTTGLEGEELSEYAQKQIELAGVYRDNTKDHINNMKSAAIRKDFATACTELNKAASSWKAVLISIEPVAREIKLKKPAMMNAILYHGDRAIDSMEPGLAECERMGL